MKRTMQRGHIVALMLIVLAVLLPIIQLNTSCFDR